MRFLDRLQPLALLGLRLLLAVVMIGHGYGKVFHGGLGQHVARVSSMGLPGWLAYPSAFAEFFGGILVLAGLFTRCAALAIAIDMVVAIWKVHWKNGLLARGGMEFPLALIVIAFALMCYGAGPIAIDAIRGGGRAKKKAKLA